MNFFSEVIKRKLLNTLIFYLGGSWAVIEALSFFIERYHWNESVFNYAIPVLGFGLPGTLIYQWFRSNTDSKTHSLEIILQLINIVLVVYFVYQVDPESNVAQKTDTNIIENSIAVLPFQNLGSNTDADFYGDGFADDIITTLSKGSDFMVISRTSSFQFRDTNRSIKLIRTSLNVANVLEGSFRVHNDQIRLNVNLVETETENNLWSESFTGNIDDIFSLQNKVALEIAKSLQVELEVKADQRKIDPLAYQYYRKGIDLMRQKYISKTTLEESIEELQKAIKIDSTFAEAYTAIAEVYIKHLIWGYAEYTAVADLAQKNIANAKKYGANDGDIYGLLAGLTHHNYNWEASERYCSLAIVTNPNNPFPYWINVRNNLVSSNKANAIASMKKLIQLDPLTSTNTVFLPWTYSHFGEYDLALDLLRTHLEKVPNDNFALWNIGNIYNYKGEHNKAIETFISRSVKSKNDNWALGYAYGRVGNTTEANRIAQTLIDKKASGTFVPSFMIGYIFLGTNDLDQAFYWFEKEYDERLGWLGFMKANPSFDDVRDDERYLDIMKRINLD